MFMYIFIYLVAGFITMYIAAFIMICKLYKMGFNQDAIYKAMMDCIGTLDGSLILAVIYGWVIWPIRLLNIKPTYEMLLNKLK